MEEDHMSVVPFNLCSKTTVSSLVRSYSSKTFTWIEVPDPRYSWDSPSSIPRTWGGRTIRSVQLSQRSSRENVPPGPRPETTADTRTVGWAFTFTRSRTSHSCVPDAMSVSASTSQVVPSTILTLPVVEGPRLAVYRRVWNAPRFEGSSGTISWDR